MWSYTELIPTLTNGIQELSTKTLADRIKGFRKLTYKLVLFSNQSFFNLIRPLLRSLQSILIFL
jgi:hypothetical protein